MPLGRVHLTVEHFLEERLQVEHLLEPQLLVEVDLAGS